MKNFSYRALRILLLLLTALQLGAQNINTVAGGGGIGYNGDNIPAIGAKIDPYSFTLDKNGNIYIADNENYRIRKVNTSGVITTIAGTGISGHTGDGGPATSAKIGPAVAIMVDSVDNIFFTEWTYNTVRKINTAGIITTIAGNGTVGFSGDGGPATAAQFAGPNTLLIDKKGNIYVCDLINNHIRKITPSGIITSIAGTGVGIAGGYSGDGGPATAANLKYPGFAAWGPNGDIYFCQWPHAVVRKIDTLGFITTVVGSGIPGYSGDGGAATNAQLNKPTGVAIDSSGNIYIAECNSHVIRKVDAHSGLISTIAGTGTAGYAGDGGPASDAQFHTPDCLFFDNAGNLYINDYTNSRIRKIIYNPVSINEISQSVEHYIFPNPSQDMLQIGNVTTVVCYHLCTATGTTVATGKLSPGMAGIDISVLPEGIYMLELTDENGKSTVSKVIKMQR